MRHYIALLRKDTESDFGVEFVDFPGCITAGSSLEEARLMAEEALAAHIEFLREEGEDIPEPSTLDDVLARTESKGAVPFLVSTPDPQGRAVRINITMPENVLKAVDTEAQRLGLSRSAFLTRAAREKIEKRSLTGVN